VPAVERPDASGEREIERLFAGFELEVLDRYTANAETDCLDLRCTRCSGLCNCSRRPIDRKNVAVANAPSDLAGSRAGTAADLEDSHSGPQRQSVNEAGEAGR